MGWLRTQTRTNMVVPESRRGVDGRCLVMVGHIEEDTLRGDGPSNHFATDDPSDFSRRKTGLKPEPPWPTISAFIHSFCGQEFYLACIYIDYGKISDSLNLW